MPIPLHAVHQISYDPPLPVIASTVTPFESRLQPRLTFRSRKRSLGWDRFRPESLTVFQHALNAWLSYQTTQFLARPTHQCPIAPALPRSPMSLSERLSNSFKTYSLCSPRSGAGLMS